MSDLIDNPTPGQNAPEFTVSQISSAVKRTVEGAFDRVRIKGEVGRIFRAQSGHLYFDLKDEKAVLASIAWKGVAARLRTAPEEGMEVVATGKLSTFPQQSKYNFIVDDLAPAGLGALMIMLEKRKKALQAEGLFAPERKKPIPYLPKTIGVVTSPSGAVIRDILHRLRDRFPRQVLIWPVVVQGEKCASEVAGAIRGFNALSENGDIPRPDLLIVARGGGSLEDLWGFNEEAPVRAAAESDIPIISAVGHETDTTLIDFAADKRAPTPTAAAEMAVPVRLDLLASLSSYDERRTLGISKTLEQRGQRLRDLARILPKPHALLGDKYQHFDTSTRRLDTALAGTVSNQKVLLAQRTAGFMPQLLNTFIARQKERLVDRADGMLPALQRHMHRGQEKFSQTDRLSGARLYLKLESADQLFAKEKTRFDATLPRLTTERSQRLNALSRMHASLGYKETLSRGYAVVRNEKSALLPDLKSANSAQSIEIEFRDGRLSIANKRQPAPKPDKSAKDENEQGSLF